MGSVLDRKEKDWNWKQNTKRNWKWLLKLKGIEQQKPETMFKECNIDFTVERF